ncbi:ABC transporter ATP-binding protein [Pantoea sp. 1.19]|uniref:ABC transporter ATP-binding protein n=1 Tax=Pantoea sp. 1.19 TaxID=1925589 RepID=UPI000948C574|nr:ATP-binding cassette domain-containing protein [Pantoea sp. 1.19]
MLQLATPPFLQLDRVSRLPPATGWLAWRRPSPAPILHAISLTLARHERVGLVGMSGCGKSTLLRTLLALEPTDAGAVYYEGERLRPGPLRRLRAFRRRVQYLPQDPAASLPPGQRVAALLSEPPARLRGERISEPQLRQLLARVELSPTLLTQQAGALSGGQAQRVALARALSVRPAFLLADEPVSSLDLPLREQMKQLLLHLAHEQQMGLLMVSHDISVLTGLCDRLLVMDAGRLIDDRPLAAVMRTPHHALTRRLLAAAPVLCTDPAAPVAIPPHPPFH